MNIEVGLKPNIKKENNVARNSKGEHVLIIRPGTQIITNYNVIATVTDYDIDSNLFVCLDEFDNELRCGLDYIVQNIYIQNK